MSTLLQTAQEAINDYNEFQHAGVKGMKWGIRKSDRDYKKAKKALENNNFETSIDREGNVATKNKNGKLTTRALYKASKRTHKESKALAAIERTMARSLKPGASAEDVERAWHIESLFTQVDDKFYKKTLNPNAASELLRVANHAYSNMAPTAGHIYNGVIANNASIDNILRMSTQMDEQLP